MTESALLLREAFNESVNYMTWSFYSLITAYVSMAFYDRVEVKTRINNYLNKLLFVIAMSVFIPNMYFVSMVFSQKLGTAAGVASFIIGLLFMMLNSAPVITYRTAAQRLSFMSIVSWVFICFIRLRKMKSFNSLILNAKKFLNDQNYRVLALFDHRTRRSYYSEPFRRVDC